MSDPKEERATVSTIRLTRRRGRGRMNLNMRRRLAPAEDENTASPSPDNETTINNNSSDASTNQMTNISNLTPIDPDDECVICRERKENQSFLIPCMHTYCYQCILRWIRINPTCPLCKATAQKIIHSIKSDTDFREYEIRPHQLPPPHIPSDIHIHSTSPHMLFTFTHNLLAGTSSQSSAFNPLGLAPFNVPPPTGFPSVDARAEAIIGLTSNALRSVLSPGLLRRLAYVNRLVSFPVYPDLPICSVNGVITRLRESQPRCTFLKNLEVFCRREIGFLSPWIDYSAHRSATQLEVACKPIGSQALCATSRVVKTFAHRIVQSIKSNPYQLKSIYEFSLEIGRLDKYEFGGDELLQQVSPGTLQRFAWEIVQFSRYTGDVDQYYNEISLFRDEIMRQSGSPVQSNAVYRPSNRTSDSRFAYNFDDVCRSTAQWLFRKLFYCSHSPYMPPASLTPSRSLDQVGCELSNSALLYPRSILGRENFAQHRTNGIRALLSVMCTRRDALDSQSCMIELVDIARISGIYNRIVSFDNLLFNKRLANLISAFSTQPIETGTLRDISSDSSSQQQVVPPPESSARISRFIVVSDDESSDQDDDDDEVQVLSETRPTTSTSSKIPPCCRAHRRHCCCCKKRSSTITVDDSSRSSEGISALFQEFLEYWEHRKKRRRVEPIALNTPNDPIVISDDEERDSQQSPKPGPSTRHPEHELRVVEKTEEDVEVENILHPPTFAPPQLEQPETADEFYTILTTAMNCDNVEEAQSSRQRVNSPTIQPQIEPSTSHSGEGDSQNHRPNSAPIPLCEP